MRKISTLTVSFLLFAQFSFSQLGQWQWAKAATGLVAQEGCSAATDKSGNLYATGYFVGPIMVINTDTLYNPYYQDAQSGIYIIKYSPAGNLLWAQGAITKDTGGAYGYGIATDASNNVFVTGAYNGNSVSFGNAALPPVQYEEQGVFIAKFDSMGNALWAKGAGGINIDFSNAIATDSGGNAYITGSYISDSIRFGAYTFYSPDVVDEVFNTFIVKYNPAGQVVWARSAAVGKGQAAAGTTITTDRKNNVYAAGYLAADSITFGNITLMSTNGTDGYVVKYDSAGNLLWAKCTNGGNNTPYGIAADDSGNTAITGVYVTSISFDSVILYCTPGNIVTGVDYYVAKYDANGNVLWAENSNGCFDCQGLSVAIDKCGNIFTYGGFETSYSYPTLALGDTIINIGDTLPDAAFIAAYKSNGQFISLTAFSSGGDDVGGFCLDNAGNVYVGSDFFIDTVIIGPDTLLRTSAPYGENGFVAKFNLNNCLFNCPNSNFIYSVSPAAICAGDSALLSFTGDTGVRISPSAYVMQIDSLHAWLKPPATTVFTISGYSSCNAYSSQQFSLPVLGSAVNVTYGDTVFCPGDSSQLCATPGFSGYQWNTFDTTACIYARASGNYEVTVTGSNNCSATAQPVHITVYPTPSVSIVVKGDTLSGFGANAYQWFLNDTIIPGATGSVYIARQAGTYSLQVTDASGCKAMSDGVSITGISEISMGVISIFPNPTTGSWELMADDNLMGAIASVFDAEGRLVYKTQIGNRLTEITIDAAPGIYLLKITGQQGEQTFKLVKE